MSLMFFSVVVVTCGLNSNGRTLKVSSAFELTNGNAPSSFDPGSRYLPIGLGRLQQNHALDTPSYFAYITCPCLGKDDATINNDSLTRHVITVLTAQKTHRTTNILRHAGPAESDQILRVLLDCLTLLGPSRLA